MKHDFGNLLMSPNLSFLTTHCYPWLDIKCNKIVPSCSWNNIDNEARFEWILIQTHVFIQTFENIKVFVIQSVSNTRHFASKFKVFQRWHTSIANPPSSVSPNTKCLHKIRIENDSCTMCNLRFWFRFLLHVKLFVL